MTKKTKTILCLFCGKPMEAKEKLKDYHICNPKDEEQHGEYVLASEKSALERFDQKYPNLEMEKIRVRYLGNKVFETIITTAKQKITFGNNWQE